MAGIRGKNTKPEIEIRKRLFSLGYRYRLHDGCFWHAHNCKLFKWPSSRKYFWKTKLTRNREKDKENNKALKKLGWRILTIWECSFRGTGKNKQKEIDVIINKTIRWLNSSKKGSEIKG
jgi:DNA mismatch endonuclease (patch repair protein)